MTLNDFMSKYDFPGYKVLLEGKRDVKEDDQPLLTQLGHKLPSSTKHMMFRSGNAPGADEFFSLGVFQIDPEGLQVIKPYTSHRNKTNPEYPSIPLDNVDLMEGPEVVYQFK